MDLKRFFLSSIDGDTVTLDKEEFYHCVTVTRHKIGYDIIATSGDGWDYLCKINYIGKDYLTAEVKEKTPNLTEPSGRVILFQGVCKELDFIAQKAVELGVIEIYPFISQRTNIKAVNPARLNRIVYEAAKQCGRAKLTKVYEPVAFLEAVRMLPEIKNRILCYEESKGTKISEILDEKSPDIALFIGSEGGFTPEEVKAAEENGIKVVTLGKRILRAETAAVAALALSLSAAGEF